MIMLATETHDCHHCPCIGHLGQCDMNRNDPICVVLPEVAKASTNCACCMSLSLTVLPTNVANVNDPLHVRFSLRITGGILV
jgi:hypothetical protein